MGREAYRMGVKLINPKIAKDIIVSEMESLGARDTQKGNYGKIDMEIAFDEGYLEILIYNQLEYTLLLNESLYPNDTEKHLKSQEAPNVSVLEMRFAKANSPDLVDRIVGILRTMMEKGIIKEVGDLEVRESIDISDYALFKERVKQAHDEFIFWNGKIPYPIRCNEVYDTLHKLYPERYRINASKKLD